MSLFRGFHLAKAHRDAASPLDLLTRQKALLDRVFARVPEAVVVLDTDDRVLQVNPEFTNLFGYTEQEACGRLIGELIVPEERWAEGQDLSRRGFRGQSADLETVRQRKDGVRVHVSIVSGPVSVEGRRIAQYVIYRDITERNRAEQRLRDSEAYLAEVMASKAAISLENARAGAALRELESNFAHMNRVSMMGELAASLAHEIMQPIATVRNNARAALNFLDKDPPNLDEVREALGCVVDDANRAGHIVGRIRDQIRRAPMRKDQFDLNAAISEMILLARNAVVRNGVSVQTRLAGGLFPVQGDCVQLQQVILNLILNAVEAMGSIEAGARELLISTEQTETNGVLVAVRDSGPGIDAKAVQRVFEPFYTTKTQGVGMGLSICRSIINAHGGRLWADANKPRGAVFQFTLPGAEGGS
jgi:PAS domain S-box-containing protein